MVSKHELINTYGLSAREAEFVMEYITEVGEVETVDLPFVIVNIRTALSVLDAAFDKTYTLNDMRKGHNYIPQRTSNFLLDSMAFYGIKTL